MVHVEKVHLEMEGWRFDSADYITSAKAVI